MTSAGPVDDASSRGWVHYGIYLAITAGVVAVILLGVWISGQGVSPPTSDIARSKSKDIIQAVQDSLARDTSPSTIREIRNQLNEYIGEQAKKESTPIPELPAGTVKALTDSMQLDKGELQELESRLFTPLDDHYLDRCFLFHDAVTSLEIEGLPPADQAEAAFRWVVRQVDCREPREVSLVNPMMAALPPEFVLRRGWGSSLERSLVFLEILRQVGIDGGLVVRPHVEKQPWAVAALVGPAANPSLILFDPRLGLPIPGADGKGIATLKDAQTQEGVFKQLTVDPKFAYDVTTADAAQCEVLLVPPLESLSARMGVLQEEWLGSSLRVNLAVNPVDLLTRFERAAGTKTPIRFYHDYIVIERQFMPPEEGGIDKTNIKRLAEVGIVLQSLVLPQFVREMPKPLREDYTVRFAAPFLFFYLEPGKPRDDILRGRYARAVKSLDDRVEQLRDAKNQYQDRKEEIDNNYQEWLKAITTVVDLMAKNPGNPELKAQYDQLRKDAQLPLEKMFGGEAADQLSEGCIYQMALCMQEKAERRQSSVERLAKAGKTPPPAQQAETDAAWRNAISWWQDFLEKHEASIWAPWARLHKARCHEALKEKAKFVSLLSQLNEPISPMEQTAGRYRAHQLR